MPWISFIILAIALAGLGLGANHSFNNAVVVARHFGFSEFFIGLTVVSTGTESEMQSVLARAKWDLLWD